MAKLKTELCGILLDNPIIPASGTFGYGYEFASFYDLNVLGSLSFKGTTLTERFGNPTPRIAETTGGMLNSVGLQNPGVHKVINEELPKLKKVFHKKVISNINGFSIEEYVQICELFNNIDMIGWYEINISCPNVHGGGMSFGTDPISAAKITKAVKTVSKKPIIIKLTPNVTDITEIAKSCEGEGADGLCLINTLLGMRIDINKKLPILANTTGGLSGSAIFPIALRMVYDVYNSVKIPIVGLGGINSAKDVIEMMLAGAVCVQIGTANLINPFICKQIINDLPNELEKYHIKNIQEIIGGAH